MEKQAEPKEQAKELAKTGLKVKRNRHFHREILENTAEALVTKIVHKPVKGEQISATRRKDHKFNPKQTFFAGRPL